jgi:hypothetical protein
MLYSPCGHIVTSSHIVNGCTSQNLFMHCGSHRVMSPWSVFFYLVRKHHPLTAATKFWQGVKCLDTWQQGDDKKPAGLGAPTPQQVADSRE